MKEPRSISGTEVTRLQRVLHARLRDERKLERKLDDLMIQLKQQRRERQATEQALADAERLFDVEGNRLG